MAESHVVSGLIAKRSELAGQVTGLKNEIKRIQDNLDMLDGTLKLFAPEIDLRELKAKQPRKRNQHFAQGEAQRLLLDIMREEGRLMSSREITDAMIARKGIAGDWTVIERIQKNVLGILNRLEPRKIVKLVRKEGEPLKWKLV